MPTPAEDLNHAIRELIDIVRTADLDGLDLADEIRAVRTLTGGLQPYRHVGMRMQATLRFENFLEGIAAVGDSESTTGVDERARRGHHDPNDFFPYSPVVGALNPLSPPVRMRRAEGPDGSEIHGVATFGAAYNGPPGCVHGGVIAEVFDELLGSVCVTNGLGGFTGTLTVIYRSTTPLDEQITMRGWLDRTEGRKIFAKATMSHGDTLCAEAEGIFIQSPELPGGGVPRGAV